MDGNREVVAADGSVQRAVQQASESLMGAVPVPARLGGGVLFWNADTLYRARSFLSDLEPVASIETNAIGVEFGHDFVLVLTEHEPPRAFNLERHQQVPLSPHGVTTIAGAEDERVLALDAAGRALSSLDGGKSWKDVGATLGATVRGVHEDASGVAFVLDEKTGIGLEPDGRFVRRPFVEASARPTELPPDLLLTHAVAAGAKVSESSVLLGDGNGTRLIDVRSGRISARKPAAPAGFNCRLVSPRQEGVLLCFDYGMKAKTIVVSHALSSRPQLEKTFTGTQTFEFGDDILGIHGNCEGTPLEGTACVRQSSGVWLELNVPAELLRVWQPLTWVPRFDGSLALVAFEREAPSPRKVALIDLASGSATAWDVPLDELPQLVPPDFQPARLRVLRDGTLRGFTSAGSISVDPRGHVRQGRKFASLASAGEYALAREGDGRFWQTSDLGEHWQEVQPPPDSPPREAATRGRDTPRPAGFEASPKLGCSLLGCVIEHRSGVGAWLRLGWPQDPPRTPEARLSAALAAPTTLAPPPKPITVRALPQLSCVALGAAQLPVKLDVQRRSPPTSSPLRWVDVFAGQRKLAQRGAHPYLNVAYRDAFETESYLTFGLRGVVHLEDPGLELQPLRERHSPLEALFVEPLDPSARVQHARGSLRPLERDGYKATPTVPGAPAAKRRPPPAEDFNPEQGSARPLLSTRPGHSAGVLLLNGALSFWASSTGRIEPVPPDCAAENGYVDGRGKLFVSCGSPDGATRIVQADDGSTRLQLHAAAHFRIKETLGTTYHAPGALPFVNPDAVAVGDDGKLRVLRLPPGSEPPTADNPAWLLADDTAPIELAPWSTLQVASSAACAGGGGFRAVIQTLRPWLRLDGASPSQSAMTALVRWSTERVCLEAVEVGYSTIPTTGSRRPLAMLAVARFGGPDAGYVFVGSEASAQVRVSASCEFRNSE